MNFINSKLLIAIMLGGIFECYDFMLCAFMALQLKEFFFAAHPEWATFGIFTAAFFARPIGGIIWSHFGDKKGRKGVFFLSTLLMMVPTLSIALFPSHLFSPKLMAILFILLRVFQGLLVGGEFAGAVTYISEIVPKNKKGFFVSVFMASLNGGTLLASFVTLVVKSIFSEDSLNAWAWRIPFLVSILLIFLGVYFRNKLFESPDFLKMKEERKVKKIPFLSVIQENPAQCLEGVFLALISAAGMTTFYLYFPQFFSFSQNFSSQQLNLTITTGTLLLCALMPLGGFLGDKFGRRNIFLYGTFFIVLLFPIFFMAKYCHDYLLLNLGMILVSSAFALANANYTVILSELFPVQTRFSGVSFSYNTAYALGGGLLPILYGYFSKSELNLIVPNVVLVIILLVIFSMKRRYTRPPIR